jgi:hypothetical protein
MVAGNATHDVEHRKIDEVMALGSWLLALGSWLIAMVRISTAQRCGNAFFGAKDVSGFQRLVLRDGCDQSGRHLAQLVLAVPSTGKPRNQE